MFESLQPASADPILGLIAEYRNDLRTEKIDLGVGVYRTTEGNTPVLQVVKRAEQTLIDEQDSKAYIGTAGAADFNAVMQELIFGESGAWWFRFLASRCWNDSPCVASRIGMGQRADMGKPCAFISGGGFES